MACFLRADKLGCVAGRAETGLPHVHFHCHSEERKEAAVLRRCALANGCASAVAAEACRFFNMILTEKDLQLLATLPFQQQQLERKDADLKIGVCYVPSLPSTLTHRITHVARMYLAARTVGYGAVFYKYLPTSRAQVDVRDSRPCGLTSCTDQSPTAAMRSF